MLQLSWWPWSPPSCPPPPVPSVSDTSPRPCLQPLPHSCRLSLQTSSGPPSPVMALASPSPLARLPCVFLATDGHPHLCPQPATASSSGCISLSGLSSRGPSNPLRPFSPGIRSPALPRPSPCFSIPSPVTFHGGCTPKHTSSLQVTAQDTWHARLDRR